MAGPAILRFQRGLPQSRQYGERLRLLVIQGSDTGICYCLLGNMLFLGREDCQIDLSDENISKKHAELNWSNDHYSIRDLGSANGVIVNGKKVHEVKLNPGDIILLGMTALQVYGAGQVKLATSASLVNKEKEIKKTKEVEKKTNEKRKLLVFGAIVILLSIAYSASDTKQTVKEHTRLELEEPEPSAGSKQEKDKKEKDKIKTVFDEFVPKYGSDTQQRKDSDKFFHSGMRELQNKNYRRAINAFETALTVDPTHELARIYLTTAKKRMSDEVAAAFNAAKISTKSLRYKEARIYYESILRMLDGNKDDESYTKADNALKDLDRQQK